MRCLFQHGNGLAIAGDDAEEDATLGIDPRVHGVHVGLAATYFVGLDLEQAGDERGSRRFVGFPRGALDVERVVAASGGNGGDETSYSENWGEVAGCGALGHDDASLNWWAASLWSPDRMVEEAGRGP